MNIKNYTSSVPVERTVSRIEQLIAEAGASNVAKSYEAGKLVALCFKAMVRGKLLTIRLPVNTDAVYRVMCSGVKKPRAGTIERLQQQAERTSWKLMQDWVEVQLALIKMGQAEFVQVFLPYIWSGTETFYDAMLRTNFKALPESTE